MGIVQSYLSLRKIKREQILLTHREIRSAVDGREREDKSSELTRRMNTNKYTLTHMQESDFISAGVARMIFLPLSSSARLQFYLFRSVFLFTTHPFYPISSPYSSPHSACGFAFSSVTTSTNGSTSREGRRLGSEKHGDIWIRLHNSVTHGCNDPANFRWVKDVLHH